MESPAVLTSLHLDGDHPVSELVQVAPFPPIRKEAGGTPVDAAFVVVRILGGAWSVFIQNVDHAHELAKAFESAADELVRMGR